jgi:hypothetical protein
MTTEIQATEAAQASATATAAEAEKLAAGEAVDEAELEGADSGEGAEQQDSSKDEAEDKVQAEVDKATRKARRRIDRLIADRGAAQERVARLEAELAEAKSTTEDGKPKPKVEDPKALAEEIVLVRETAKTLSKVMKEATAKFGATFEAKVSELVEEIGPQLDPKGRPTPLMEAVLDSDRAAEVLNYLGENTEVAAELAGLSPARLGRRINQIESDLAAAAKPKPSAAAKPLSQAKPSAAPTVDPTKLTDAQWHALRKKAKQAA